MISGWSLGLHYNNDSLREDYAKKTIDLQDPVVDNITRNCSSLSRDESQVKCVQSKLSGLSFRQHNEEFLSPLEVMQQGGLCRDVVVMQTAIFKRLGWGYTFTFPLNKHVFTTIWTPINCTEEDDNDCGLYCNLDWGSYACYRLTG
jgi:hypothetical protein